MLPNSINFLRPGLSANFNDGSGITLSSSSSLSINAGYVGMFAGNISITGTEKLVAEKGASIISLENDFYNSAGIIKENGSDRASNPKFTDDEPTNGAMEAKAAMEMMMNASALAAANDGSIGTIVDLRDTLNKPWANTDSIGNSDKPEEITSLGDVFNRTGNAFKEIGSDFYKGLDERRKKALDSPYDFVNYLTLGLPDTVKGMLNNNQKMEKKC